MSAMRRKQNQRRVTFLSKILIFPESFTNKRLSLQAPVKVAEEKNVEEESSDDEPTTLIDPVTGMLMVMRAKEEGKYVPVPNAQPVAPPTPPPPAAKTESMPIVNEGLASHWLAQETLKVSNRFRDFLKVHKRARKSKYIFNFISNK